MKIYYKFNNFILTIETSKFNKLYCWTNESNHPVFGLGRKYLYALEFLKLKIQIENKAKVFKKRTDKYSITPTKGK